MKTKNTLRAYLALLLTSILLLGALPVPAAAATPAALNIAVLSDPHIYPDDMTGGFCEAYIEAQAANGRALESTQKRFEAALADLSARVNAENLQYLLVPGDTSEWGELAGHELAARLLEEFEDATGVEVLVIPGNHDLSNGDARDFSTGALVKAEYLKHDDYPAVYSRLGYELAIERFGLSYTADLGGKYRLIAADTNRRRIGTGERYTQAELREWVLDQCAKAEADGKIVVGMGHHPLGEMFGNMDTFMGDNFGFGDACGAAEAFAEAGMHYYFSGHLHFNEIAQRVSDAGEPLYDIMTAATAFFPGGYRIVNFSELDGKIEADVRSVFLPLVNPSPHPDNPFYDTLYGRGFGAPDGSGLAGWVSCAVKFALGPTLEGLSFADMAKGSGVDIAPLNSLLSYLDRRLFGQPERLLDILNGLAAEILALPVSKLPCTRFIDEFGFGGPAKPGTFEDLGNSALIYLFGKRGGAATDAFVRDALRRFQNGEFVDQLLNFAVPKLLAALGGEVLPLLLDNPAAICALQKLASALDCPVLFMPLLALAAGPNVRAALSDSLYRFAGGVMTGQSPTSSPDGLLVYDGPVEVPTGPLTYRLPQDITVDAGWSGAEITWYTKAGVNTPALIVTDKNGNPAPEVQIAITSAAEEVMAGPLDIGYAKLMGRALPALKHTARLTGLKPGKTYHFTAGDSTWDWWAEPVSFTTVWDKVLGFFGRIWDWLRGLLGIVRVWLVNAGW
ncbi:MAG: metallophosphoesterase [Firmicutes bacterium]|nr:metallophosphoesterase [Bacillota bacterium]